MTADASASGGAAPRSPGHQQPRIAVGSHPREHDGRREGRPSDATQLLITLVFAALVVATLGGAFLAQALKHAPTAVQGFRVSPSFEPAASGPHALEQISFRTAHAGALEVTIINASGESVATLVHGLRWRAYLRLCLSWNGRRGASRLDIEDGAPFTRPQGSCSEAPVFTPPSGPIVPAGDYRVRVVVHGHGPIVLSPSSFSLERGTVAGT